MQVYRLMDIGTAKPTFAEREQARFHLLDLVLPDAHFNVADWKSRAEEAIRDTTERGVRAIICGGTGMYVRALLQDWSLADTARDSDARAHWREQLQQLGPEGLHQVLRGIDSASADRLHPNDVVRVSRALEVYSASGQPLSVHRMRDRQRVSIRQAIKVGVTLPREHLYARIERRVDAMFSSGLVDEVTGLVAQGYDHSYAPMRSLGYKEVHQLLRGEIDYAQCVALVKQNTRRFAKRQQTWYRAEPDICWFDCSSLDFASIAAQINTYVRDTR